MTDLHKQHLDPLDHRLADVVQYAGDFRADALDRAGHHRFHRPLHRMPGHFNREQDRYAHQVEYIMYDRAGERSPKLVPARDVPHAHQCVGDRRPDVRAHDQWNSLLDGENLAQLAVDLLRHDQADHQHGRERTGLDDGRNDHPDEQRNDRVGTEARDEPFDIVRVLLGDQLQSAAHHLDRQQKTVDQQQQYENAHNRLTATLAGTLLGFR